MLSVVVSQEGNEDRKEDIKFVPCIYFNLYRKQSKNVVLKYRVFPGRSLGEKGLYLGSHTDLVSASDTVETAGRERDFEDPPALGNMASPPALTLAEEKTSS
jgi:hypothetical protein